MLQVVAHSLEKRKNTLRDRIVKGFVAFDSKIPSLNLRDKKNLPLLILREGWGEFKQTMNRIYQGGVS